MSYVRYVAESRTLEVKALSRRYILRVDAIYDMISEKLIFLFPYTSQGKNKGISEDFSYFSKVYPQFEDEFGRSYTLGYSPDMQLHIALRELEKAKCGERKFDFRLFFIISGYLRNTGFGNLRGGLPYGDLFALRSLSSDSATSDPLKRPIVLAHEAITRGCLFLYCTHHPASMGGSNPVSHLLNQHDYYVSAFGFILSAAIDCQLDYRAEGEDPLAMIDHYIALGIKFRKGVLEPMVKRYETLREYDGCEEVLYIAPRIFELMKRDGFEMPENATQLYAKVVEKSLLFDLLWNYLDGVECSTASGGGIEEIGIGEGIGEAFFMEPKIDDHTKEFFACSKILGGLPECASIIVDAFSHNTTGMIDDVQRDATDLCAICSDRHIYIRGHLRISPKRYAIVLSFKMCGVCRYGVLNFLQCFIANLCSDPRISSVSVSSVAPIRK